MSQVARSLPELIKIYPARRSRPLDPLTLESGVSGNDYQMEEGRGILGKSQISGGISQYKNVTLNAMALILGVSERTIQRWKPETLKQKRLSQEEVQKIYELRDQGKTQREIAEEIGVSQSAVNQNIRNDKCQNLSDPSPSYLEPDDPIEALPILGNPKTRTFRAPKKNLTKPNQNLRKPETFFELSGRPKRKPSRSRYLHTLLPLQPWRI